MLEHDNDALGRLESEFGEAVFGPNRGEKWTDSSDPWIGVAADRIADACRFLRDTPGLEFDFLNDLTVVDYAPTEKKLAKAIGEPRLEVVYHLSSLTRRKRLTLKATLPRWRDDTEDEPPEIPSVVGVWSTADWHECEAFDLFGVRFVGHPNLRRLLCPEDWEGHALRKDYAMPLEYHGIRGR